MSALLPLRASLTAASLPYPYPLFRSCLYNYSYPLFPYWHAVSVVRLSCLSTAPTTYCSVGRFGLQSTAFKSIALPESWYLSRLPEQLSEAQILSTTSSMSSPPSCHYLHLIMPIAFSPYWTLYSQYFLL